MADFVEIIIEGKSYKFPAIIGTEGEKAIDIRTLRQTTGYVTLDTGFKNTASTQSSITFLDGEKGILRYRGFPIEQLAEKSNFIEVAYMLICGDLPTKEKLDQFLADLKSHWLIHEDHKTIMTGFPTDAHPMGVLSSLVTSLTAFFPESLDPFRSKEKVTLTIIRLLAKMPTLVAWSYTRSIGRIQNYPNNRYGYVENFLHMMFSSRAQDYEPDPVVVDAMDKIFILHADHEQNCSTSTVRIVGSSQASLYASVAAGVNALWGPLHGGANQKVIEMLQRIHDDGGNVQKFVDKAKDPDDPFRMMGFGHRVYKNFDPRAKILKKSADQILNKLHMNDPLLEIAKKLEEVALKDEYFIQRKLYPNVDFYSGLIMKTIGIPVEMFPVMFSIGRLPGWIAQWKEMREHQEPIGRPRQVYSGETTRDYIPIEKRKGKEDAL
jgi:citrate synthase